jgi:hypothetical protein
MKERRPSGEPVLAEVGPPVILSLGIAGYCRVVSRERRNASVMILAFNRGRSDGAEMDGRRQATE